MAGFCDNDDENSGTTKDVNFFASSESVSFSRIILINPKFKQRICDANHRRNSSNL